MKVGDILSSKSFGNFTILSLSSKKVTIKFLDTGFIKEVYKINAQRGEVKDPTVSTKVKGYIGVGKYTSTGVYRKIYKCWRNMLQRCYCEKFQKKYPTYVGCYVDGAWLCFQNFAEWALKTKISDHHQLDKDVLCKGNKVYSEENCCWLPKNLNIMLAKANKIRGNYPIGLSLNKHTGKIEAKCGDLKNNRINLGQFNSVEKGFQVYKDFKEKIIRDAAELHFRNKEITEEVYRCLLNYRVEITD